MLVAGDGADDVDQGRQGVVVLGRDLGQHAVGRIHHDQGIGAALAPVDQHGLGQQADQGALAVAHDGDGFVGRHPADLADQHGQAAGGQDEVAPMRRLAHVQGVRQLGLRDMADQLVEALAIHVQQVVGGIGKEAAALGEVAVQAVVVDVLVLVAQLDRVIVFIAFYLVGGCSVAPVERDHQAAGFRSVGIAAIKMSIGIVEQVLLIVLQLFIGVFLGLDVVSSITSRLEIRPIQALIDTLAQPRLH
ncbi:hypothetical protein D3C77_362050 [compost metagenome]